MRRAAHGTITPVPIVRTFRGIRIVAAVIAAIAIFGMFRCFRGIGPVVVVIVIVIVVIIIVMLIRILLRFRLPYRLIGFGCGWLVGFGLRWLVGLGLRGLGGGFGFGGFGRCCWWSAGGEVDVVSFVNGEVVSGEGKGLGGCSL